MRVKVSRFRLLAFGLLAFPMLGASQAAASGGLEAGCQATAQNTFNACMKDPINHESYDKCKGDGNRSYSACLRKSTVRDTSLRDSLRKKLHEMEVAEERAERRKLVKTILTKCQLDSDWCWSIGLGREGEVFLCGRGAKGPPDSGGPGLVTIGHQTYYDYKSCPKEVLADHSAEKTGPQPPFRVAKTPPPSTVTVPTSPKVAPTPAPREAEFTPFGMTPEFMRELGMDVPTDRTRTRDSGVSGTPSSAKDFGHSPPSRESKVTGPGDGTTDTLKPRPDSGARPGPPSTDRPTAGTPSRESGVSGTIERPPAPPPRDSISPPRDSTSTRTSDDASTVTRRASPVSDGATVGGSEPIDPAAPGGVRFGMQPPVGETNDLSNVRNKVLQLRKSGS
jgi:hypothetical protein